MYENRFAPFTITPFPRFITYEMYKDFEMKDVPASAKETFEKAKNELIDGKNILQKLIQTDDNARNTLHLSKEYLEKLQRLVMVNSLNTTKVAMYGPDAVIKVNKDNSLPTLLAIDVEKKQWLTQTNNINFH